MHCKGIGKYFAKIVKYIGLSVLCQRKVRVNAFKFIVVMGRGFERIERI